MNVAFSCPACRQTVRCQLDAGAAAIDCPRCGQSIEMPAGALAGGELSRCLVCPSTDLYVRKDFPQRLGVAIVTVGILASCVTWGYALLLPTFAILFATAAIDVVLYLFVPDALMCYRCGAIYRSAAGTGSHGPFNLETHERYRQQAARLAGQEQR